MVEIETKKEVSAEDIKKLYNIGYRNFIAGDYSEAADALQEVCRWNSDKYGEKGDECADSLLLYGRCLLELGRAENCVLGNALKGFSNYEYESQEEISTDQFEDPSKLPENERVKLRCDVTEAMAEPETVEEEAEAETGEAKTEAKKDEAEVKETVEAEAEKMETEKEEPSTEKAEGDSITEDPDALPSLQLAWEMIELARLIYKQRSESMERDVKISECYLRLGEIGLENESYTGAIGDLLECKSLQKQHFPAHDRRIAETHYHLGVAYSFEKRFDNAKENFEGARNIILKKIDICTEDFDSETEKSDCDEKKMSDLTNEIAQLKELLPDLNSKLEDNEASIKNEKFEKVSEHLDSDKKVDAGDVKDIQHLVKRKQEEKDKMNSLEKKSKMET